MKPRISIFTTGLFAGLLSLALCGCPSATTSGFDAAPVNDAASIVGAAVRHAQTDLATAPPDVATARKHLEVAVAGTPQPSSADMAAEAAAVSTGEKLHARIAMAEGALKKAQDSVAVETQKRLAAEADAERARKDADAESARRIKEGNELGEARAKERWGYAALLLFFIGAAVVYVTKSVWAGVVFGVSSALCGALPWMVGAFIRSRAFEYLTYGLAALLFATVVGAGWYVARHWRTLFRIATNAPLTPTEQKVAAVVVPAVSKL